MKNKTMIVVSLVAAAAATATAGTDFAVNGGFETGDTSGWVSFPTASSTFNVTIDANSGNFGAELFNDTLASGAVVKQANLGAGVISAGDTVDISFAAKGSGAAGGVAFAEFFSEIDGGGVSDSVLLGGTPLALTDQWQVFNFSLAAGPDVSGGVTLQFASVTGADPSSVMVLFIDDVSVSFIPAPGSLAMLGLGGLVAVRRRR